jgi:dipeptidyl aminopeptidase/acylaminoacyl peptidase
MFYPRRSVAKRFGQEIQPTGSRSKHSRFLPFRRQKTPPILILHGTEDKVVSLEDWEAFDSALEQAGVEHQLVIVDGAQHSFDPEPR